MVDKMHMHNMQGEAKEMDIYLPGCREALRGDFANVVVV